MLAARLIKKSSTIAALPSEPKFFGPAVKPTNLAYRLEALHSLYTLIFLFCKPYLQKSPLAIERGFYIKCSILHKKDHRAHHFGDLFPYLFSLSLVAIIAGWLAVANLLTVTSFFIFLSKRARTSSLAIMDVMWTSSLTRGNLTLAGGFCLSQLALCLPMHRYCFRDRQDQKLFQCQQLLSCPCALAQMGNPIVVEIWSNVNHSKRGLRENTFTVSAPGDERKTPIEICGCRERHNNNITFCRRMQRIKRRYNNVRVGC